MSVPDDDALRSVLDDFGVEPGPILGRGGEAVVVALDAERVLRIGHRGGAAEDTRRRRDLLDELRDGTAPFALPEILDVGESHGRAYAVERRLRGRSLLEVLPTLSGAGRRRLVERAMDAAAALGDLPLEPRPGFGELIGPQPLCTATWHEYLTRRAATNLGRSDETLRSVDPAGLADGFAEPARPGFVHLDAFAGNMLTDGTAITAVIDIGPTSLAGDRTFDPLSVAAYLAAPEISPGATAADADVARGWLRAAGLAELLDPATRWLAAYWAFAVDHPVLLAWCRRTLLGRP